MARITVEAQKSGMLKMIIDTDDCDPLLKRALKKEMKPEDFKKFFKRKPKDNSKHDALKILARVFLEKRGISEVRVEETISINGKNVRIDVIGLIDGKYNTPVECGSVDFSKIAILASEFNEVIVIPYNMPEKCFIVSDSLIREENIGIKQTRKVKAAKSGEHGGAILFVSKSDLEYAGCKVNDLFWVHSEKGGLIKFVKVE